MAKVATKRLYRGLEIKSLDDSSGMFEGYGSVFGVEDWYRDVVMPGAFTRTLATFKQKGTMPKLLWQHDPYSPCGVFLQMHEDQKGLYVKGQLLLDVEKGAEAYSLLKHKAIDAMSIGYSTVDCETDKEGIRKLKDVDLWEVSLVTFPANQSALVTNVKGQEELPTIREFERWLTREAGFTRSQAEAVINDGFKSLMDKRDAVPGGGNAEVLDALKQIHQTITQRK